MKPLFFLFLFFSIKSQAHPVTYQGGTMLKSMFREDMSENSVTYTWQRRFALGLEVDRLFLDEKNQLETSWGFVTNNILVKRWNGEDSQANIYASVAGGGLLIGSESEGAGKASLQFDYETRQFYTLAQWTTWQSKTVDAQWVLYKIGFAPFVAGYNDLNIWCILQLDYSRQMRNEVQVTPFLRFYFKNILWEVGSSLRGNFYGQFMVHL